MTLRDLADRPVRVLVTRAGGLYLVPAAGRALIPAGWRPASRTRCSGCASRCASTS